MYGKSLNFLFYLDFDTNITVLNLRNVRISGNTIIEKA